MNGYEALTGITNAMVADAPPFAEVAADIYRHLQGRLFVAHNARFDYGFLKNALQRVGHSWSAKVLCTVKLSRTLFPQYKQHNMDALIARHQLVANGRHRALADVELMQQFLEVCRQKFGTESVDTTLAKLSKKSCLPAYLSTSVDDIPDTPGVYLFYGENGQLPIYIGKSINLRTRILSHFSADHRSGKEFNICQQVRHIEWRETAGELGALLLESKLVKELMPIYNRQLRRQQQVACFRLSLAPTGYKTLQVTRASKQEIEQDEQLVGCFKSQRAAEATLRQLVATQGLCSKLCGLEKTSQACFHYQLKKCRGACVQQEDQTLYNLRVELAVQRYQAQAWPFAGVIGIKEYCRQNEISAIHLFNNWHYLGSVKDRTELADFDFKAAAPEGTFDEVKILRAQLKKISPEQILPLDDEIAEEATCVI